jgi:DNA repair exonuclease SbcCD ATPase subunit
LQRLDVVARQTEARLEELHQSTASAEAALAAWQGRLDVVARQTEARLEQNAASLAALRAEVAPPDGPSVPGLEITLRETAARIEAQAEKEVASLHDELSRLDARQAKVEDDAEMCVRAVGEVVGRIDLIEDGMVEAAALVEQVARSGGGPGTAPKLAS